MPKDMVPTSNNPASVPRLPAWLTDILDADHPDIPWRVPARLPTAADLRHGLAICERIIDGGVTPAFAKQCLAKLLVALEPNTKLSTDEMRLRASVWLEACGDLNDALWAEATAEVIRTSKWMPKPAEFRAIVQPKVDAARKHRLRLREMMVALNGQAPTEKPLATRLERLKHTRSIYDRMGDRQERVAQLDAEIKRAIAEEGPHEYPG